MLFHWSPKARRKQILKEGLCPGKISRCRKWHPPYVAFSFSPSAAWGLSAMCSDNYGEWDLWMVWSDRLDGYERLPNEFRVYRRILKKDIWYVGTREYKPRKRSKI